MFDAIADYPLPSNEPILTYAPQSSERAVLKNMLAKMSKETIDIPLVIHGKNVLSGNIAEVRAPHRRELLLGRAHEGTQEHCNQAIQAALHAHHDWSNMPWQARAAIFLRAAEILSTRSRAVLNASTMLNQSKNVVQAEIDAACEFIDFLRFNVAYSRQITLQQPQNSRSIWNIVEPRPLEGFVFAATPFNFTAIAGNLCMAPALMGNTIVWKPSPNAMLSAHYIMQLFMEAGLPPGVINLIHGPAEMIAQTCLEHPDLAGIHFTGSTTVFQSMWKRVGENIHKYKTYPRLVGETGGKDFVFAHASADVQALVVGLIRGAYEYQGQKCSAASRAYIPQSLWPQVKERLLDEIRAIQMGDVSDFRMLMGAVIDERSFTRLRNVIEKAKSDSACTLLAGGTCNDSIGYFVAPTLFQANDPKHWLMQQEFFGPILTIWVYPDQQEAEALAYCNSTSPYGLTGALFSRDRAFIERASNALRFAAGNLYINDKPTGAVVGQQPFGGGRSSGTNDKAGSILNLHRWVCPRTVKEALISPLEVAYPSMMES